VGFAIIGQEEQFVSRKTSRSQLMIEYEAKQEVYTARERRAKMATQAREDNGLGRVPLQSAMRLG
jgi:hypothetical protein